MENMLPTKGSLKLSIHYTLYIYILYIYIFKENVKTVLFQGLLVFIDNISCGKINKGNISWQGRKSFRNMVQNSVF